MAKKNATPEIVEKALENGNIEKVETIAKVDDNTDVIARKEYATFTIGKTTYETFLDVNASNASEIKADIETGFNGVFEALALGRKSALRLSKALYFIKSKEIYKWIPRKNDKTRTYSVYTDFVADFWGIGKTLANNAPLAYEKFFLPATNPEEGILVGGRPAIEYNQTALIELLPVMAEGKETEKDKVFNEITPLAPIKDVKGVMEKYHVKKDIKTAGKGKDTKKTDEKKLSADDILKACLDLLKGFATAEGAKDYTKEMLATLDKIKLDLNGIIARRENA